MAVAAFPTGYYLSRSTAISNNNGVAVDVMDDNAPAQRTLSPDQYTTFNCVYRHLTVAEKNTLEAFLEDNAANIITQTIDGTAYIGVLVGGHKRGMVGAVYTISFTYYATELVI